MSIKTIMDISTALDHIKDKTDSKLSIKAKIVKLLASHSLNDRTQDISTLYKLFLQNEEDFTKPHAMPSEWKSKRSYSVGFQAMRITMTDVEPIKLHFVSTFGEDVFNSLRENLHHYEKKFDIEYKQNRTSKGTSTSLETNIKKIVDGSEKNSVNDSEEQCDDFQSEIEEDVIQNAQTTKTNFYELEIKTVRKQLHAALKVILDLQELETDFKTKKLIYTAYETIISMND